MPRPISSEQPLAAIARATKTGGNSIAKKEEAFGLAMRNFLDVFYATTKTRRARLLAEEPEMLRPVLKDGGVADAYLAALANYLASQFKIKPPLWAHTAHRLPDKPWFALSHPDARVWLITQSPAAFRERNLFISADALTRA